MCSNPLVYSDLFAPLIATNASGMLADSACTHQDATLGDAFQLLLDLIGGYRAHVATALIMLIAIASARCLPTFQRNDRRKVLASTVCASTAGVVASAMIGACTYQLREYIRCDMDGVPTYVPVITTAVGVSMALVPTAVCVLSLTSMCVCKGSLQPVRELTSAACTVQTLASLIVAFAVGAIRSVLDAAGKRCGADYGLGSVGSLDLAVFAAYASALSVLLVACNMQASPPPASRTRRNANVDTTWI